MLSYTSKWGGHTLTSQGWNVNSFSLYIVKLKWTSPKRIFSNGKNALLKILHPNILDVRNRLRNNRGCSGSYLKHKAKESLLISIPENKNACNSLNYRHKFCILVVRTGTKPINLTIKIKLK